MPLKFAIARQSRPTIGQAFPFDLHRLLSLRTVPTHQFAGPNNGAGYQSDIFPRLSGQHLRFLPGFVPLRTILTIFQDPNGILQHYTPLIRFQELFYHPYQSLGYRQNQKNLNLSHQHKHLPKPFPTPCSAAQDIHFHQQRENLPGGPVYKHTPAGYHHRKNELWKF